MIKIDYTNSRSIHEQIEDGIKKLIVNKILQADEQLPSVRDLSVSLTVNPNTVQKSISLLESEGLVVIKGTQGCFVTEDRRFLVKAKENQAKKLAKKLVETAKELSIDSDEMLNLIKEEYEK